MSTRVSVVVPTFRRRMLLGRCLEALLAQDMPGEEYEIIIVDDEASKETRMYVENWARRAAEDNHSIHYLATSGSCGPAAARNRGWLAARGEIIAFTDDDCIPAGNWLSEGLAALTDNVTAVAGRIRVPLPPDPSDYEFDTAHLECSEFATANCFYRRTALLEVGGFDERFKMAWREDSDLFFTLLECSARCLVCETALVVHPVRPARWGISLSQQRKSMFNALLYKKHPRLYRARIQAVPLWNYYCAVGALLVAALGVFGDSWPLVITALAFWCLLTIRLCQKRLRYTSHTFRHVSEMVVTSALLPPLALFWRLRGMLTFRVFFW